ncbi:multiple C2 and transmembrane domain-containing protein-like [Plodia interpunctella]|uniref:multiple C2 and transmembrane domain-containing protein-like n=1 Tax=Plodia interpunctella TaxID=58824 RepID=UPI0023685F4B|nr:multiple C2 and transmembrane domain-containing protein-like [Plodia interpunctella]
MERENNFNVTKMKHFAKLHEKIQNKYNEMQRKLEKSKSVESLTTDDYNSFKDNMKCSSTNDLTDDVFIDNHNKNYPLMHTVIVEDINKIEISITDVHSKAASVSESAETSLNADSSVNGKSQGVQDPETDNANKNVENVDMVDEFLNEWIFNNDMLNEIDEDNRAPSVSASPRPSLRSKIGSRMSAVRERRRESKEKRLLEKKSSLQISKSDKLLLSSASKSDVRLKERRTKFATVTIALIEVSGLNVDPADERLNLQCRFRLGVEKHKSKLIKNVVTPIVKWQELFNMNMYDDNLLEISLMAMDKRDGTIGKTTVDLSILEQEKTHVMRLPLEGSMDNAEVFYLLTISGTPYDGLLVDLDNYQEYQMRLQSEDEEFSWFQLEDFGKVGRLSVIVYGAKGLALPDCYCSLKLVNQRRQTHTEYRTNDPNWMKTFTFDVTDITSKLEVFVRDERKDEEVGRIVVPLLRIRNDAKVWYILKDETLRERARGQNPAIQLEMRISWNIIKASLRIIRPKEIDYLETSEKFDRKLFFKNIARAKGVSIWILDFINSLRSCFEWESRYWNTFWLIFWLLFNWYFRPWMVPLLLIIPFIWYRPPKYFLVNWKSYIMRRMRNREQSIDLDKIYRKTLWQKINNLQDLIYTAQIFLGKFASFGESVKNLFNFSDPYVSLLAIFFLLSISTIICLIPVKYLFMGWGIKKYVRKMIWPNRVPHSEVMDLISRVPNDEDLIDYELLPTESAMKSQFLGKDKDEEEVFQDLIVCEEDTENMQNIEGI